MRLLSVTAISIATILPFLLTENCTSQERLSYDQIASRALNTTFSPPEPKRDENKDSKVKKPENHISKHGVSNFDIYRDCNTYPVDPRKPCHICIQRKGTRPKVKERHDRIYGFQGRPYREREPGACLCGKKKQKFKFTNINVYWPASLAGVWEDKFPVLSDLDAKTSSRFHIVDIFDKYGGFEVSRYQRRDNGFFGPGFERYGCLGESKTIEAGLLGETCNECSSTSGCGGCGKSGCVCSGRNRCPNWNAHNAH